MKELTVNTSRPYRILIEEGCLNEIGAQAAGLFSPGAQAVVVSDSNVAPLYASQVEKSLQAAGFATRLFTFPAGETSKRLATLEQLYSFLAQCNTTRSDFIVALGGGVTGDMAGFAAATYLRGIGYIQVPTTLLSQIDSSVGGKTAVDLPQGKNLVGAFWQPRLVLIDPLTINTLSPHYFADGMGEAIKYGCIRSAALFNRLEKEDARSFLPQMIAECVDIKRQIVEHDERDTGERMLLNFGHTLGHALEKLYHFETLSHGQAVGVGMVMITRASERAGLTHAGTTGRICALLRKYGLPESDSTSMDAIAAATNNDKKSEGGTLNLVLLSQIGESFLHPIPRTQLTSFLKEDAQ
ncbi:MAG TPA: 3-dehydroquinate synthase [Candidatus Gallacutalibacter stercoravium]|nr:3-dehydroquinate synthase [Candidatus Gallacutalibacter stercoravium]